MVGQAAGGTALDPKVVGRMLGRRRSTTAPIEDLTPRDHEVLAQLAEGKSTSASPARAYLRDS